ncbi:MAG: NAD-binding protein, partial [Anaerolineales bacterium]|nr:NAD-binding protein [Anaerolineales bacterium]
MRRGKYLRNFWSDYRWFIILVLGVFSLVLGYIGFQKNGLITGEERTLLDNLYLTLGLVSMDSGAVPPPVSWELQVARFLVPAVTAYTAFLAFTSIFIQQTDRIRLWFIRDQVIICGLGRKGFRLATQFLHQGYPVVVIEMDEGNDWIENARSAGAIVIHGDASDPELLEKVNLHRARCLISVLGDDGKNAEVAVQAEKLSRMRKIGTLTCIIHIFDSQLWGLLREKELYTNHNPHFRLELFNIFDRGARLMLQANPPWMRKPTNQQPHILVVGLGKMGQRLVVEAARGWRMHHSTLEEKLHISIIDLDAEQKLEFLQINYPRLDDLCDLTPVNMNILSGDFERAGSLFIKDNSPILDLVYVCLDDETFSLQTGLRLNQQFRPFPIPIVLRMVE